MHVLVFIKKEKEENEIKTKRQKKKSKHKRKTRKDRRKEKKNGNTSSKIKGDAKREWVKGEEEPTEKSKKSQVFSHRRPYEKTTT